MSGLFSVLLFSSSTTPSTSAIQPAAFCCNKMPSFSCFLSFTSSLPPMIGIISQNSFSPMVHNSLWYLIILMLKLLKIWPMGDLQALSYIVNINHPLLFWMLPLWHYTWPWNLLFQQGILIFFFLSGVMGWTVPHNKICLRSNCWYYLWMQAYLEIEFCRHNQEETIPCGT